MAAYDRSHICRSIPGGKKIIGILPRWFVRTDDEAMITGGEGEPVSVTHPPVIPFARLVNVFHQSDRQLSSSLHPVLQ